MLRVCMLCWLLLYVCVHALHGDPAWSPYPLDCASSTSTSLCARLGANASASLAFLQPPPTTSSSLSDTRTALLAFIDSRDGWTVLDSNTYRTYHTYHASHQPSVPHDSSSDVVLVRVRALDTLLALPSDINIRIHCSQWQGAGSEVWVQSASRVGLLGLDFGLNLRHVDDIASWVRQVEDADGHSPSPQPAACEAATPTALSPLRQPPRSMRFSLHSCMIIG